MNIFVLEDDYLQQLRIMRLINEAAETITVDIKDVFSTGKPKELINRINSNRSSQMLYFLDIEIDGDDKKGLEVARKIRALDRFATIVFITVHSEFSILTYSYQVSALQFLAKDQEDQRLMEEIKDCLEYVQKSSELEIPQDVFCFENEYRIIELPYAKILYFETFAQPHKIALITVNQRIEFYASLSEIEEMDERFYRCHKSVVVNLDNIIAIDRRLNQLKMVGGSICYVSKRKLKDIQKKRWTLQK